MNREKSPSGKHDEKHLAPWLPIPSRAISVVEHPCILKNVDKGITSLGGAVKLSKALTSKPEAPKEGDPPERFRNVKIPNFISASLRPDDPYAKLPKRTGRKRKRGSSGPFLSEEEWKSNGNGVTAESHHPTSGHPHLDVSTIFQRLQDNASKYTITPVGVVDESHRFRLLPDIQFAASRDDTMTEIKHNLFPLKYSQLKSYNPNTAVGADLTKSVALAPEYLQMGVAYGYKFQQNPFVKYTGDEREEVNIQRRRTRDGYWFIKPTEATIPTHPKPHLPPERTLSRHAKAIIKEIRAELARRPIITRHLLYNRIGWDKRDQIREASVYCGYFFESGPWREALVVWGLDPRKDPKYRHYQTISFQSYIKLGTSRSHYLFDQHVRDFARMSPKELEKEHTFDGVNVSKTGNMFQFCDISDPMMRGILDTKDIRETCAPTFHGWYHVGTWAKATVILKDKMNRIIGGEGADDTIYARVLSWPEEWDDQELYATYRKEMFDKELHRKNKKEHDVMHMVRIAAKSPRYAFEKMQAGKKDQRGNAEADEEDIEDDEAEIDVPRDTSEVPDTADALLNEGGSGGSEGSEGSEGSVEDDGGFGEGDEDDDDDDDDDEGQEGLEDDDDGGFD